MAREIVLIFALLLSVYLIYISIDRINAYDKRHPLGKSSKWVLIYVSILLPVVGYFISRKFTPDKP